MHPFVVYLLILFAIVTLAVGGLFFTNQLPAYLQAILALIIATTLLMAYTCLSQMSSTTLVLAPHELVVDGPTGKQVFQVE